jgi:HlyD family secretion protein
MKRLVPLLLTAAAALAGAAWYRPWAAAPAELRLPGTVEIQEVRLGSRAGGRVAGVLVKEGESVTPGQVLVRFEPDEPTARRNQARERLAAARAALRKAEAGPLPEEVAEAAAAAAAARAKLARVLSGFRDEEKRQAKSDLDAAAAVLRRAEEEYARAYGLDTSSQSELDAARAARDQARGKAGAARALVELVTRGSRPEDIDEARAEVERVEARHALLKRGTRDEDKAVAAAAVAEAEARLAETEAELREAVVVAPDKATVEVVAVRAGDVVPAGQPVVRVLRADDVWVKVFVPATELGKVKLGAPVQVAVDSHPGRRFAGTITFIASVSEFTPRNVQSLDERRHQVFAVKITVADPDGVFKSGMAAEAFLDVSEGR